MEPLLLVTELNHSLTAWRVSNKRNTTIIVRLSFPHVYGRRSPNASRHRGGTLCGSVRVLVPRAGWAVGRETHTMLRTSTAGGRLIRNSSRN